MANSWEEEITNTYPPDITFTNITWVSHWFQYLTALGFVLVFGEPIRSVEGHYSELECISNPTTGERYVLVLIPYDSMEFDYVDQNGFKYVLEHYVPNRELLVAAFLCNNSLIEPLYNTNIFQYINSFMSQ
jgi:hypothetical protein